MQNAIYSQRDNVCPLKLEIDLLHKSCRGFIRRSNQIIMSSPGINEFDLYFKHFFYMYIETVHRCEWQQIWKKNQNSAAQRIEYLITATFYCFVYSLTAKNFFHLIWKVSNQPTPAWIGLIDQKSQLCTKQYFFFVEKNLWQQLVALKFYVNVHKKIKLQKIGLTEMYYPALRSVEKSGTRAEAGHHHLHLLVWRGLLLWDFQPVNLPLFSGVKTHEKLLLTQGVHHLGLMGCQLSFTGKTSPPTPCFHWIIKRKQI